MRTVAVTFTPAEHRVLRDLAAAEGIDVEALIREALALPQLPLGAAPSHLRLVRGTSGRGLEVLQAGPSLS